MVLSIGLVDTQALPSLFDVGVAIVGLFSLVFAGFQLKRTTDAFGAAKETYEVTKDGIMTSHALGLASEIRSRASAVQDLTSKTTDGEAERKVAALHLTEYIDRSAMLLGLVKESAAQESRGERRDHLQEAPIDSLTSATEAASKARAALYQEAEGPGISVGSILTERVEVLETTSAALTTWITRVQMSPPSPPQTKKRRKAIK